MYSFDEGFLSHNYLQQNFFSWSLYIEWVERGDWSGHHRFTQLGKK
jgi:hypothetical protein